MNLWVSLFELASDALFESSYSRTDEALRLTGYHVFAVGVEKRNEVGMLHEFMLQELEASHVLSVHEEALCIQERDHDPNKIVSKRLT
jgi:hypothetical protein